MTDDLRSQERFGGRQRSVERGRRRQHQRESSRRRRAQHASPYKRSSLDRPRKPERMIEYEGNNSIGFFGHREGSGNLHPVGDRGERAVREGSVSDPAVGQGIWYSATHGSSYGQEIYGTPGKHPYDQLISPYATADHCSTLQYSYNTGILDADHIRNGNANASQDDTLREFGAQHTTSVACQTPTFPPFGYSSSKFYDHLYTNSDPNQIRSEFVSLGDNSYEIPGIPHTSSAVQGHGNASPVSATSAMSISSGRSPRSVFSNNRSDTGPRKGPICIKCQKPEYAPIDLIVTCSRCLGNYHTSCHNPTISVTRGVINVDSRIWKCQRCATRLTNPGNGSHRQSVSPTRFRPRKIPRLSANTSDTSSGRSSSLSKGSTRMTFSPADLQDGSARNRNGHSRNSKPQPGMGGVLDSYGARASESLGNGEVISQWNSLAAAATPRYREGNFVYPTGDDISPARPIGVDSQRTPQYSSHDCPSESGVGVERRLDVLELSHYSDGTSRSANVFSGSRKLAVVIDNRSRSGSASTNGCQGEGWNCTPPAAKDPRDDVTPIPHSKLRQALNSPAPQEFSQPSADQSPFLEGAGGSTLRQRGLKRSLSILEAPDSQEEHERDFTGGPMTLESLEGYRRERNSRQPANGCRSLPAKRPGQQAQDRTAGDSRHERLQRRFNRNDPSNAHSNEELPRSRPSSSSRKGKEAAERPTTERTGVSSPHYSPPPPDAGANGSPPPLHNEADRLAPRLQAVRTRSDSVDSVVSCRRCGSDMTAFDNKRVDVCSPCVRREHCRGSDLTDTIPREPSHSTAPSYHSPAPPCLRLRIDRKNDLRSRHSPSLSATGSPDNRPNTTPSSDSPPSDTPRGCTPQELRPVEVFRTAKQRVIERYQMKFPEITTGGLPSQPIKETAIGGQKARKVMDLPKSKTTTAEKLKTAAPLRKSGASAATLVQTSARVDARKSINGSALPNILPATEPPKHNTKMTVMSISQLKKSARKGPAIKYAGGSVSRIVVTDDSPSESDHSGKLRALEKRLQDQKGYTKNQAEKAAKLQVQLQESEKEKAALREKLKAFLALGNNGVNEEPTPENENPEPRVVTEFLPAQGSLQQVSPKKKKVLKRLVRWEEAHSDQSTPQEDPRTEPSVGDDKPDTGKKTFRYGSMRDFYSGSKFCGEDPWAYPKIPEQPEPDPSTFRKHGWRKTVYRPFDQSRLMKVHLHRLTSHNRPPLTMTIEENPLGDDGDSASTSNTPIGNKIDKPENEHGPTRVPRVISFDEFMGLPENMVPTVKDGCLGFRSGIINPRTGRLERNVPHYRIRAPGDLKPT